MATSKDIIIFGATGVIGVFLTQALVDAKASFGRLAIFTSPSTVERKAELINKLKQQGVEIIVGDLLSENELDAAREVQLDEFNAQHQEQIVWTPSFNVAGAYFDQAVRSGELSGTTRPARVVSTAPSWK